MPPENRDIRDISEKISGINVSIGVNEERWRNNDKVWDEFRSDIKSEFKGINDKLDNAVPILVKVGEHTDQIKGLHKRIDRKTLKERGIIVSAGGLLGAAFTWMLDVLKWSN